jgi:spore cortex biosynthesis protein YabQ
MKDLLIYELTVFGGAAAAGVLIAFLYDLFRLKRRIVKTKSLIVHIEDVLYWLFAAIILFLSSYLISSGETRGYFYIGTILGGIIYLGVLSRPVLWLLTLIIQTVLFPVKIVYKALKPVFDLIYKAFIKLSVRLKKQVIIETRRVRVNFGRFRNAFTKK